MAPDPHGQFASPYNAMGNIPTCAVDPNGRDAIVLNSPKGVFGFGHNALLIGDDIAGWTFISKEGRGAGGNFIQGGPAYNEERSVD